MAIATENINAEDNENVTDQTDAQTPDNDDEDEVKAKRERIDLEAVDPTTRVSLNISVPAGLKLALLKAGEANGQTGTSVAMRWLAERLEYDIPASFLERTRKTKYANEEERKKAAAERAKNQHAMFKEFMAKLKAGQTVSPEDMAKFGV